jgi:hypothetical protein
MGYGPAMTPDYRPSLVPSFERHMRAGNRSERTIATYLQGLLRQPHHRQPGSSLTAMDVPAFFDPQDMRLRA